MGLLRGDLEKVPKGTSAEECYERIYRWHERYGRNRIQEKYGQEDAYSEAYLNFLDDLPVPDKATEGDMDFVFGEVIYGLMEWSYHEEDMHGTKMAAYAEFALKRRYGFQFLGDEFDRSRKSSRLFDRFGYPKLGEAGVSQAKRLQEEGLREMRSISPNASPQKMSIEDVSVKDLPRLAEVAYADIDATEQIGGRALLLSFSLARNPHMFQAEKGTFTFYNAPALGLEYQVNADSLVDHIHRGTIHVSEAIAEPSAREE